MLRLILLLILLSPHALASGRPACGLSGCILDRIRDCNEENSDWKLVTVTKQGHEVWKDPHGLIWGELLTVNGDDANSEFTYAAAVERCSRMSDENGDLGLEFRLPTLREYQEAHLAGILYVLPHMKWIHAPLPQLFFKLWTSTKETGHDADYRFTYWARQESNRASAPYAYESKLFGRAQVRCVVKRWWEL